VLSYGLFSDHFWQVWLFWKKFSVKKKIIGLYIEFIANLLLFFKFVFYKKLLVVIWLFDYFVSTLGHFSNLFQTDKFVFCLSHIFIIFFVLFTKQSTYFKDIKITILKKWLLGIFFLTKMDIFSKVNLTRKKD